MVVLLGVMMFIIIIPCIYVNELFSDYLGRAVNNNMLSYFNVFDWMEGGEKMLELLADFWCDEEAVGVVEIILILVVLISLVLIFKSSLRLLYRIFLRRYPARVILYNLRRLMWERNQRAILAAALIFRLCFL